MTSEPEHQAQPHGAQEPRRLHGAAIVVEAARSALRLVGGFVLVAIVRGGTPGTAALLALAAIVVSAVVGYVQWRATTYWLDDVGGATRPDGVWRSASHCISALNISWLSWP